MVHLPGQIFMDEWVLCDISTSTTTISTRCNTTSSSITTTTFTSISTAISIIDGYKQTGCGVNQPCNLFFGIKKEGGNYNREKWSNFVGNCKKKIFKCPKFMLNYEIYAIETHLTLIWPRLRMSEN